MHNNFHFFRHLVPRLEELLLEKVLLECFSQNKDELILRFEDAQNTFFIKAVLSPDFCCLSFPNQFNRSRKNSADIFTDAYNGKVVSIKQYLNERAFLITLDNHYQLLFKMHGNRSNIILFHHNENVSVFKNNLINDKGLTLDQDRQIDQSFNNFIKNVGNISKLFPTFGKVVIGYLRENKVITLPLEKQWDLITEVVNQLDRPIFYTVKLNEELVFSLLKYGDVINANTDPVEALNEFFFQYITEDQLGKQKRKIITQLERKRFQLSSYISKTSQKLLEIETSARNEHVADLIMANLHAIQQHATEIELIDFYTNKPVKIKLKKDLSPQKNAEDYYRKGKNKKIEVDQLKSNIKSKQTQLEQTDLLLVRLYKIEDIRELKSFLKADEFSKGEISTDHEITFKEYEKDGFRILVGKNAKNNDDLTQRVAWKEDLWLHAKDVAGSHVVIKYQSGQNFPKPVIEYAARLAAYYSKRKNDSLCPVIYTPKKYVRKRKGAAPGSVIVERETIIMVPPMREEEF